MRLLRSAADEREFAKYCQVQSMASDLGGLIWFPEDPAARIGHAVAERLGCFGPLRDRRRPLWSASGEATTHGSLTRPVRCSYGTSEMNE